MIAGPAHRHDPDRLGRTPRRQPPDPGRPSPKSGRDRSHKHSRSVQRTAPHQVRARPGSLARGFWQSLTHEERHALVTAASRIAYPAGTALWEEGQVADHLVLIFDGYIRVCVVRDGLERLIATRGPGDIIGERAALQLRQRSASVVALTPVRGLRMTTGEFAAFLTDHPRVVAILEKELYERLTEAGAPATDASSHGFEVAHVPVALPVQAPLPAALRAPEPAQIAAPVATTPSWAGQMCSIMFADIAGFSAHVRNDDDRLEIRQIMYGLLREAFENSDVPWDACYREDRGDGALIVVPPEMPPRSVIDPMLALLAAGLRRHNHRSSDALRIQLRLALNVGPVMPDAEGVSGSAIIYTARLLDAPVLKARLAETRSDLGFIASGFVYKNVVVHAPGFVVPDSYQKVCCTVKETEFTGWMHLSGGSAH
ncbi:cyclic nucleotide-binding domain-containing protein [Actinomadura sp. 9N407]|uniref:cyclic nucleotide-binding domain-containing protein n=1 Tax=Actinomadura sp. 9N407 TaxID=3375154 RepID=UPI0037B0EBAF